LVDFQVKLIYLCNNIHTLKSSINYKNDNDKGCTPCYVETKTQRGEVYLSSLHQKRKNSATMQWVPPRCVEKEKNGATRWYLLTAGITTQRGDGYLLIAPFFSSRRNVRSTCTSLLGNGCASPIPCLFVPTGVSGFWGWMMEVVVARERVVVGVPSCHGHLPSIPAISKWLAYIRMLF